MSVIERFVTVLVPVFRNEETLVELHRRVATELARCGFSYEILLIDDASDDRSAEVIRAIMKRDPAVRLLSQDRNSGQQQAVLRGMREARGELVAVLDADLQDPPEALGILLSHLDDSVDVVFAGRRGEYESKARLRASRVFKRWIARLTALPADAGMFLVMKARVAHDILESTPKPFYLPTATMAVTRRVLSIPVERSWRGEGTSQYSVLGRLRLGIAVAIGALRLRSRRRSSTS